MKMDSPPLLDRIRFVLVETTHTGNLGATARAMKTMGLSQLHLVRPKTPPDAEAMARAAGADDLLAQAGIHASLADAIAGCRLVIGSSARLRAVEWPLLEPPECVRRLLGEARDGPVALVLGRERSGLTNEELALCHFLVHIPTNPDFSSLNLGAAAQVFAYEIRQRYREGRDETGESLAPEKGDRQVLGSTVLWTSAQTDQPTAFPRCPWRMANTSRSNRIRTHGQTSTAGTIIRRC